MLKPTAFSSYEDVQHNGSVLRQLAAGASNAKSASDKCQNSIQDIQRLLDPQTVTQYHFKTSKLAGGAKDATGQPAAKKAVLSPFAKMVRDTGVASYRYLTPEDSPEPNGRQIDQSLPQPPVSRPNGPHSHAEPHHAMQNGYVEPQATPAASSQQSRPLSVVIPRNVSQAERALYLYVPESESNSRNDYLTPSKPPGSSSASRPINAAQREKADVAVQNLTNLLDEIFQAQDQIQPDTSGHLATLASAVFVLRDTDDGVRPVLLQAAQSRLESILSKVVSYGRLGDISTEALARVQGLCEVSMASMPSLNLLVGDDWTADDVEEWLQQLGLAANGLSATRSVMRIMVGTANVKELQSEDYLREALQALKAIVEGCILPLAQIPTHLGEKTRGSKGGLPPNPKYVIAADNRKTLQLLVQGATRSMRVLSELLVKTDFDETSISSVEYLCSGIIFAESVGSERDSVLGHSELESMKRSAMDVLASIYTKYTDQRDYILQETLSSLEKLDDNKANARQYRLHDSKPITLASALLMRLVQVSATQDNVSAKTTISKLEDKSDGADASEDEADSSDDASGENIQVGSKEQVVSPGTLEAIAQPLFKAAQSTANRIVVQLLHRAVNTTKSSDEPHRKLLDIFTQDFLTALRLSEWPAAEMLLYSLVSHMFSIVQNDQAAAANKKNLANARILALELLGVMGSGIVEIVGEARRAAENLENPDDVANRLRDMVQQTELSSVEHDEIVAFGGPYRIWLEYLDALGSEEDAHLRSARGYVLTRWAASASDKSAVDSPDSHGLRENLKNIFLDPKWLAERSDMEVNTGNGKLAALVLTANSGFCKTFPGIFSVLLASMKDSQSTVQSKSMKSLTSLLEKDPTMLDRHPTIVSHILAFTRDAYPRVKDSALTLIHTCVDLRPALGATVYPRVCAKIADDSVLVRKRALRVAAELYQRNTSSAMRLKIADGIISRLEDDERAVAELARSYVETIWYSPLYGLGLHGQRLVETKLAYGSQAALLIGLLSREDDTMSRLESFTKRLTTSKKATDSNADPNIQVCGTMIEMLCDAIIDNSDIPGSPPQSAVLRALTMYARATPALFTAAQLERLEPYTQNLTKSDELAVYRYAVTILRHVMPTVTMMKQDFLQRMFTSLMTSYARLQKAELREVAPCLATISKMLGNTARLANFLSSMLVGLQQVSKTDLSTDQSASKANRLITMASELGHACDLNHELSSFKAKGKCDWYRGDSVPGLIVDVLYGFTDEKRPVAVRRNAIDGICTVAQVWPSQFLREDVIKAFDAVFKGRIPEIEAALLAGLEAFFVSQETPDESADIPELGTGIATGTERLGRTYVATDEDGAITSLAQRSLSHVLRIALASNDEPAFIAAKLIISINKQGLVHPKESGPALVALETCPVKSIADAAFSEHKSLYLKYESLFGQEYMRAVQQTFEYQSKVIGSSSGFTNEPLLAKMDKAWEVIKTGKAQVRKKFLTNITQKLDFDPAKLDVKATIPHHLSFVRFCCENLALFVYDKVDDLLHLLTCFEKVFSSTGSTIAQAIESEVQKLHVDNLLGSEGMINGTSGTVAVGSSSSQGDLRPERLHQLAVSAQIITLIHETRNIIAKVWRTDTYTAKAKSKQKEKDKDKEVVKTATRMKEPLPHFTRYLERVQKIAAPVSTEHEQRERCADFVDLMSVDHGVKPDMDGEAAEADMLNGYDTPSEHSGRKSPSVVASGGGRGRKRKSSVGAAAGPPKKRGRPRKSVSFNTAVDDDEGGWD